MEPTLAQLTLAEFLDWDARTHIKHEYVDGEIYAMSGASRRHNLIVTNLIRHARAAADRRAQCRIFGPDMKVRVELYRRTEAGFRGYLLSEPDHEIESTCLGMRLPLREAYEGVEFPAGVTEPDPAEYFPVQVDVHA